MPRPQDEYANRLLVRQFAAGVREEGGSRIRTFYRSNGNAKGGNLSAANATESPSEAYFSDRKDEHDE